MFLNKLEDSGIPNIIIGGKTDSGELHCMNLAYDSESEDWVAFDPTLYVRLSDEYNRVNKGKSIIAKMTALNNREKLYQGTLGSFLHPTSDDVGSGVKMREKITKPALHKPCVFDAPTAECRYFDGRFWDMGAYNEVLEHKWRIGFLQERDKVDLFKDTIYGCCRNSRHASCESPEDAELIGLKCLLFKHRIFSTERSNILPAVLRARHSFPLIASTTTDNTDLVRKLNKETGPDITGAIKISPLVMSIKK